MADYHLKFRLGARADSSLGKALGETRRDFTKLGKAGKRMKPANDSLAAMHKTGAKAATTNAMLARRIGNTQRGVGQYAQSLRTGTRALRDHTSAARREITTQKQLRGQYARTGKALGKLSRRRRGAGGRAGAAAGGKGAPGFSEVAAVGAPVLAVSLPVKKAIEFESAMAGVRKVVDFKEPDGLNKFGRDLIRLSKKEIPISAAGLAEIAAAGGQLGVAEKSLLPFVKTTAKMAVAFDMMPDEAGNASAKLSNVFKVPISQVGRLGDAINHLSDNTAAKANEITRSMLRVGGVSNQFGLSAQNAAALTAAFIGLGKPPEVAGTAINGMLTKLMTAEKGEKKFKQALDAMGYDAYELKDAIQNDAQGTLLSFLETIGQMDKADQMGILVDLFGREYADDIATLVGSLDKYKEALGFVAKEQNYLGSMNKEFQNKAKTTANTLQLLGNKLSGQFISTGDDQLSVVNGLAVSAGKVLDVVSDLSAEFPRAASGLAHLVGGAAAAIAVFKGLKLAGRFFKSGYSDIAGLGRKGLNLARGKRGKRGHGRKGKGGVLGGLAGAASGATPVFVVNMPGGGLGGGTGYADGYGGRRRKGKVKGGRVGKLGKGLARFGRKGILGKAAGLAGGLLGMGGAVGLPVLGTAGAKAAASGGGMVAKVGGKLLGKGAGKSILKAGGKSLLKKIPGIGLIAGLGFGISRAMDGDWLGAAGEVASGAASMIPVVGTAASIALDAGLAARDIANESEAENKEAQAKQKQAEQALSPQQTAQADAIGPGEVMWNLNITQNVNAPGADANSLKTVMDKGRLELEQMTERMIEKFFAQQQRMGFNNA
jgi:TP901 family phage tail tape measure protein